MNSASNSQIHLLPQKVEDTFDKTSIPQSPPHNPPWREERDKYKY